MNRSEAKDTLLSEFITQYGATTPVSYPNDQNFVKPSGPWVKFSVRNLGADQTSIGSEGNRRFERYGRIAFKVYLPVNTGTYVGDNLCETILSIFEGKRFGTVVCDTGSYVETGNITGDWFQFDGTCSFEIDEIK